MSESWQTNKDRWVNRYSNLSEVVLQTLHFNQIKLDQVDEFLNPNFESIHGPSLLPDVEPAVSRIWKSIHHNEKILIFTDYDADGLPGSAILDSFFKKIGYQNYIIKTPNRNVDGFGLKPDHVLEANENQIDLIITIDCGSASIPALQTADQRSIDIIITDHHEVPAWPDGLKVVALVNPMSEDSNYPMSGICGATVVFKLVQALIAYGRNQDYLYHDEIEKSSDENKDDWPRRKFIAGGEKWLLDLVAIATVGDMMELRGENRILVYYGLKVLNQTRNHGLRALIDNSGLTLGNISANDISFRIAPLINAASRLGKADVVIDLLTAPDRLTANRLASDLVALNNERKKILTQMVKQAHKKLAPLGKSDLQKVIAVGDPQWLPGMCGLLASRLVEEYQCPVFVWGRGPGSLIKGSCRSYGKVDVYQLMIAVKPEVYESFGGHTGAGGFVLSGIDTHDFQFQLETALDSLAVDQSEVKIDSLIINLPTNAINLELLNELKVLEPYGRGFEAPRFKVKAEKVAIYQFGKANEHLKLKLDDGLEAIKWRTTADEVGLSLNQPTGPLEVVGMLEFDSYRKCPRMAIDEIILK